METQAQSSRLFQNPLLESLTHVHHNTPFFIFLPVIVMVLLAGRVVFGLSTEWLAGGFLLGLFNWTWFEYGLHRLIFHYEPKTPWGKKFLYLFHGIHHDFPHQKDRLVMPPVTSIPLSLLIITLHLLLFGAKGLPMYAGFVAGYLYYEFVHYSVHHKKGKGLVWFDRQRKDHLNHHFKDAEHRFGVTSPLWDYLFGTYRSPIDNR